MADQPGEDDPSGAAAPTTGTTGVASGGLGTATNLDETQVYARDDLRADGLSPLEPDPPPPASPDPALQRVEPPAPSVRRIPARRPTRRSVHPLAAIGMVALVAAAALFVGVSLGSRIGSRPPSAGVSPVIGATPTAPGPTKTKKDHGKGNGDGDGNGNN